MKVCAWLRMLSMFHTTDFTLPDEILTTSIFMLVKTKGNRRIILKYDLSPYFQSQIFLGEKEVVATFK
jgi:hypothetical protein